MGGTRLVRPSYRQYPLAVKLSDRDSNSCQGKANGDPGRNNDGESTVLLTDADIRTWLPGDVVYEGKVAIPNLPAGNTTCRLRLVDPETKLPKVKLAIQGVENDGWYQMGKVTVQNR